VALIIKKNQNIHMWHASVFNEMTHQR